MATEEHRVDLAALRRRAANVSHRDLIAAAEERGWTFDPKRGKGSHGALLKSGQRPIILPQKLKPNVVRNIISHLEGN